MNGSRRRVVAIAQFPPPVTGLAAVSQRVRELFEDRGLLHSALNVGPPARGAAWMKFPVRAARTLTAICALALAKAAGAKAAYIPTDSHKGIILNITLALSARLLHYKVNYHHHNFSYIDNRSILMQLLIGLSPVGSRHIFLCHEMKVRYIEQYQQAWSRSKSEALVLPNAFMSAVGDRIEKSDDLTIGHLANLTVEKGALKFIALFRRLRKSGVSVKAEMAGPCGDARILDEIDALNREFPSFFTWHGPVYGEEKAAFYRRIHVFVFPTLYPSEAQPLVLLEALAHGAAILTTDIGCIACDHQGSPGQVFERSSFDDEAFNWLSEQGRAPGSLKNRFTQAAFAEFNRQREESLQALDTFLDQLELEAGPGAPDRL